MRKELIIFVNTLEKGEEISVSSVAVNRKFVILTTATGHKFTASSSELLEALAELNSFNQGEAISNNVLAIVPNDPQIPLFEDIEYGD